MTADERIEKLLNHFGQTIADLPKPTEEDYAYEEEHRKAAMEAAMKWSHVNYSAGSFLRDYICHLADVIDRMEIALETALRIIQMFSVSCVSCAEYGDCDGSNCDFTINDTLLYDRITRYMDDAD